jgi:hypothetical protein
MSKRIFFIAIFSWVLFEVLHVYFIMPMLGSQYLETLHLAYFLYRFRWFFRIAFGAMAIYGLASAQWKKGWVPVLPILVLSGVYYAFNFQMVAQEIFKQPNQVIMAQGAANKISKDRIILGVTLNGISKAYPIQFLGYHHQVVDELGGQAIMVTYCTVCRSGRVYQPLVNGKLETFRLVGMDLFNAMFEDKTTGSWWRQESGEAVTGKMRGTVLPSIPYAQMSLQEWLLLHPNSQIMQPDPKFKAIYAQMSKYEKGNGNSDLTRSDSLSWQNKSWVIGVTAGKESKAFDWNRLKKERIINDVVGETPVVLVLGADNKSFAAFKRPGIDIYFTLRKDSLVSNTFIFNLEGVARQGQILPKLPAHQEFWHSWKTFQPATGKY